MNWKSTLLYVSISFSIFFTSCQQHIEKSQVKKSDKTTVMAVLYNYYSAEYKALAFQAYNIAKERLLEIRKNDSLSTNLAIVLDLDETVFDNSPYEAKMLLENKTYSDETWNTWCSMASAQAIPGAVEFLDFADSLGFTIFYVSNRKEKFTREGTIKNMENLKLPQLKKEQILFRIIERSKEIRRQDISENYSIVLFIGDNMGDFYEDTRIFSEREKTVINNKKEFGKRFIVLPNSIYGDWTSSINLRGSEKTIDSLLKVIANKHYSY